MHHPYFSDPPTPDQVFGKLFSDLHHSGLWPDGKTIADMTPRFPPADILLEYGSEKEKPGFDLRAFTEARFDIPEGKTSHFKSDPTMPVADHIRLLWDELSRAGDKAVPGSSLIPLPHPYVVPGGRFNEIYYWDSYFTMLGLRESGRTDLIESMVKNFAHLIQQFGYIPNGNRTYFLGRSQPPFFGLMVDLLAGIKGEQVYRDYFDQIQSESVFWQYFEKNPNPGKNHPSDRLVQLDDLHMMSRYYDWKPTPRAEMYGTDLECAASTTRDSKSLFRDLRAACESGWDFSSRWLHDPNDLTTIHTTDFIPVDLNCLVYHIHHVLGRTYEATGFFPENIPIIYEHSQIWKLGIQEYLWSDKHGYYMDYDHVAKRHSEVPTLAGMYPLFFKIATKQQAESCARMVRETFLRPGGVVTTPIRSGQQWDAPNGWAPLQWITIQGLRNYGFHDLANDIKSRWVALNEKVFRNTGKLLEKYNVEDIDLPTGGGEYPVQDGFGWTNGVLLALLNEKGG